MTNNLDAVGNVWFDVDDEATDAVDSFLQFVGALFFLWVFQTLGAERAQQQSQEQI